MLKKYFPAKLYDGYADAAGSLAMGDENLATFHTARIDSDLSAKDRLRMINARAKAAAIAINSFEPLVVTLQLSISLMEDGITKKNAEQLLAKIKADIADIEQ